MHSRRISPVLTPAALLIALAGSALGQSTDPFPAVFEISSLLPENGGDGTRGFVIRGANPADFSGFPVATAGDVNGDGFEDLAIGATGAAPNGVLGAGVTYVVFGHHDIGSAGFIELSTLTGPSGFKIRGFGMNEFSGTSISLAGDINADGFSDVLIGARLASPDGLSRAGECYVVFCGPSAGSGGDIDLATLDGRDGFRIPGILQDDRNGRAVSMIGDCSGDGIDDLLLGAYYADRDGLLTAGESYVIFGRDPMLTEAFPAEFDLSSLDGSNGYAIRGATMGSWSGQCVASAGDLNCDGIRDIVIGAPGANANGIPNSGATFVVFGGIGVGDDGILQLSSLTGMNGFVVNGIGFGDLSGRVVSGAGDLNADGCQDLVIGAYKASPNSVRAAGQCYVVFGGTSAGSMGEIEASLLNGLDGFVINGIGEDDCSGRSLAGLGDVNGDGFDDVIVGAFRADPNGKGESGQSYVLFGGPDFGSTGSVELSTVDGSNGFTLNGADTADYSGISVAMSGDLNGDGIEDLLVGAVYADPNGIDRAGETYVIFGRNTVLDTCDSDLDQDGLVGFGDITSVLGNWLNDYSPNTGPGDANLDHIVNFADITAVLGNWLTDCP